MRVSITSYREGVLIMKRTCPMCERPQEPGEFIGCLCGRCDKIVGDVEAELVIVSGQGLHCLVRW